MHTHMHTRATFSTSFTIIAAPSPPPHFSLTISNPPSLSLFVSNKHTHTHRHTPTIIIHKRQTGMQTDNTADTYHRVLVDGVDSHDGDVEEDVGGSALFLGGPHLVVVLRVLRQQVVEAQDPAAVHV